MVDLTHSPPHWGRYLRTAMVGSIGSERPLSAPYSAPGARDAPAIGPAEAHAEDEQWGARDETRPDGPDRHAAGVRAQF